MTDNPKSDSERVSYHYEPDDSPHFATLDLSLGRLARHWSAFEFVVNDSIWELANVERFAGTCMTSQMFGPGPRFRCLVSLLNLRGASKGLIKAFNSLAAEADGLGRQRNRYIHDAVVLNEKDDKLYRVETTADRQLKHDFIPIELKAIGELIEKIDELLNRFDLLFDQVIAETPPWPRTQYEQSNGILRERNQPRRSGNQARGLA